MLRETPGGGALLAGACVEEAAALRWAHQRRNGERAVWMGTGNSSHWVGSCGTSRVVPFSGCIENNNRRKQRTLLAHSKLTYQQSKQSKQAW